MGHLRTGKLPRTRKWAAVVDAVGSISGLSNYDIPDLADKTLVASNKALLQLPYDPFVQHCFHFLTALSVAGQSPDVKTSAEKLGVLIEGDPTKLQLSKSLRVWLQKLDPTTYNSEYAALARQATTDTIAEWINKNLSNSQLSFFAQNEDPYNPWRASADGSGFCELSRLYFSKFTTRYLNYFLSRTASAQIPALADRERFSNAINENVGLVSQHAFETSKLVQSFSAGWFNKHARGEFPSNEEIRGFLIHSFEKIREELRRQREASS